MKTRSILMLLALGAFTACADEPTNGPAQLQSKANGPIAPLMDFTAAPGCSQVRIAEVATFDPNTGNFNTTGQMTIGNGAPLDFTSVVSTLDANWDRAAAGKNFKATEREEFTFSNGDQLYADEIIMSVPMSAPSLYDASGPGKFVGGTGAFSGAHGNIFLKGLTMFASNVAGSMNWDVAELCL